MDGMDGRIDKVALETHDTRDRDIVGTGTCAELFFDSFLKMDGHKCTKCQQFVIPW